ncbi:MAG: PIG-L family deacetylase [Planctomycetes bacterium]|nr:PIG-L family deacetylase [Planctomycetota bacterium]
MIDELPLPILDGVYHFGRDLWRAHVERQNALGSRAANSPNAYNSVGLPLLKFINFAPEVRSTFLDKLTLPRRTRCGRPILALEPHADDAFLSFGGLALSLDRPVHVVTLFSKSRNLFPELHKYGALDNRMITRLRTAESRAAAKLTSTTHSQLGLWEAKWPHQPPRTDLNEAIVEALRRELEKLPGAELLAPACVSRHPDHVLTRLAAEELGCSWFWDDVDFYVNYARSVEDREYFLHKWSDSLGITYHSIDSHVLDKCAVLSIFQSQFFPASELCATLRYNWAVAREGIRAGALSTSTRYAERIFRQAL